MVRGILALFFFPLSQIFCFSSPIRVDSFGSQTIGSTVCDILTGIIVLCETMTETGLWNLNLHSNKLGEKINPKQFIYASRLKDSTLSGELYFS